MKEMLLLQITPEELQEMVYLSVKEAYNEIKEEIKQEKPDLLITRKEAAKLLRISLPTLHEWSKNGRFKYYKIGNRVFYKRNEVLASFEK